MFAIVASETVEDFKGIIRDKSDDEKCIGEKKHTVLHHFQRNANHLY